MIKRFPVLSLLFACFSFNAFAQPAANPNPLAPSPFLPAKVAGTLPLKTPTGVTGQATNLKSGAINVTIDTTIRSNPKNPKPNGAMAYLSIDFTGITGTVQAELLSGKFYGWVYDKAGKQVPIMNVVLYSVKAPAENSTICDMVVKVPYRLKTDNNLYTIRFRWESPDHRKSIDILTTK